MLVSSNIESANTELLEDELVDIQGSGDTAIRSLGLIYVNQDSCPPYNNNLQRKLEGEEANADEK